MGQKVNPIGFRTGITEDWKSRWYAPKSRVRRFFGRGLQSSQTYRRPVEPPPAVRGRQRHPHRGAAREERDQTRLAPRGIQHLIHTLRAIDCDTHFTSG